MNTHLKLDLRQLKTFITIADKGSFRRASETLYVAQPALSRQIRMLEDALDVEVFVRLGRGVQLTTAGELLYQRARALLQEAEQLQADVSAVAGSVTGHVTLGLLPTVSHGLATAIIKEFYRHYPRVTLGLRSAMSGTLQQMVSQQKLDIAITDDQKKNRHLRYLPLVEERFALIAPPDSDLAKREAVDLDEVLRLPLILPEEKHGVRARMEKEAMARGQKINMAFEVSAWPLMAHMVNQNLGYTILSSVSVEEMVVRGEVAVVPIIGPEIRRTLAIATPGNIPPSIATMKLTEVILQQVAAQVHDQRWVGELLF